MNFITIKSKAVAAVIVRLPMISLAALILLALFTGIWVNVRQHPEVNLAAPTAKELAETAAKNKVLRKTRNTIQQLKTTERGKALLEEAMQTPEGREVLAKVLAENATSQPE
jgi:hypothetical protein